MDKPIDPVDPAESLPTVGSSRKAKRKACPWKYEPIQLRPCEVCGERATGYHFGVISCEACKSFYRRSLKRSKPYVCEKGGGCPTDSRESTTCPACRLQKCVSVGMSQNAVKKGRYSYEKRAETIIQSRTYWHGKAEDEDQSELLTNEYHETSPYTDASVVFTKGNNNAANDCEEVIVTTAVPLTEAVQQQNLVSDNSNIVEASTCQKSLRDILGISNHVKANVSVSEEYIPENITETQNATVIPAPLSQSHPLYQTISTTEKTQVFSNIQPVVYALPSQGSQAVKSPESLSDDSGVFLLSPGNLSYTNSVPPVSPYTTFTINEPETQAQITEIIPGKVRSINMRRELLIDGKPISYLLEGVLVPPRDPTPHHSLSQAVTTQCTSNGSASFSEDISVDGNPISSMLVNILDDLLKENDNVKNDPVPTLTPQVPYDFGTFRNEIDNLSIDGQSIYQTFKLFSGKSQSRSEDFPSTNEALATDDHSLTLTMSNPPEVDQSTRPSLHNNIPAASTSTVRASNSQTDIEETAQTLLNMASMPLVTSPPPEEGCSETGNSGHIADRNEILESGSEIEKLLREGMSATNDEEIRDLDALVAKTFESVEKNTFASKELVARVPEMEGVFLEEKRKKEEMFGKMGPISTEDYFKIFRETGIDIDGRSENLQKTISSLEIVVKKLVLLYKGIPGFQSLPIEDQIAVLKETHHDIGFFMHRKLYNCKEKLVTSPYLQKTFDETYFMSMLRPNTVEMIFKIAERIQNMVFTDLEVALIVSVLIMQPDACRTEIGRKKCAQQRKLNIKAFHRALCRERTEDEVLHMFRETMDLFKAILQYKTRIEKESSNFFVEYNHLSFPKLVTEVYRKN